MNEAEMTSKGGCEVVFRDDIAILTMQMGENRFNEHFFNEIGSKLDQVEKNANCRILITTGSDRFFSNGLDLDYVSTLDADGVREYSLKVKHLMYRILTFPLLTIAAINGHAFAGGAFLAMSHDYQVMNTCRGWWCLNEVLIGIPFNYFFRELAKAKLPTPAYHQATVLGRRFTGGEALQAGIVSRVVAGPVLPQTLMLAREVYPKDGYDRQTLRGFKESAYDYIIHNDTSIDAHGLSAHAQKAKL
ncbi:hypothetical protein CAPTEDRAFT_226218 [Capitella teleta]|uniref:Enoyl-CoA hydratase n=1 Tax=Capitella teleta TaxID=283909 RepID=R7TM41_CAPTE|nr:hypothetical protein CAPTEDRAFT_226218 [Capitella teleta]|eukprot:ELT92626.1 hypothetical protein CAPTEDRAFT_226218 [Capitella teleta]